VTRPAAPALDPTRAGRWRAAIVPWWVPPWQPQPRSPATVAGDLREGGWVVLLTGTSLLVPEGPVRACRTGLPLPWRRDDAEEEGRPGSGVAVVAVYVVAALAVAWRHLGSPF